MLKHDELTVKHEEMKEKSRKHLEIWTGKN